MPATTTDEVAKTPQVPAPRGSKKAARGPKRPLNHSPAAVRQAREARGLTQARLAELTGRTHTHISEIEHGVRDARPELLELIATALDCPADRLKRVRATRKCGACAYTFDPPWDGSTPLHTAGDGEWCPGGGQTCAAVA